MALDLSTVLITGNPPASLIVAEGDGTTLVVNTDLTNFLYLGRGTAVNPADPRTCITISPQSFIVFDGEDSIFGITQPGVSVLVQVIPGGVSYFQSGITGSGIVVNNQGTFLYAGSPGLGNLIAAFTGTTASGVDPYGNVYTPGGESLISVANVQNIFDVIDQSAPPNTLMAIGSDGSVSSQGIFTASDMFIGGESFVNDIYPPIPEGLVAYAGAGAHLPTGNYGAEGSVLELDVQCFAGRMYMVTLNDINITWSGAGGAATVRVRGTTDGTTPTTGSVGFLSAQAAAVTGTITFGFVGSVTRIMSFNVDTLVRLLLTLQGNIGTAATAQITSLGGLPFSAMPQAALCVYDIGIDPGDTGIWIGGGTGGGTSPVTHTKTYGATGTHCYQGSDGGNSNLKINDNGTSYQGGDRANTYNGKAKTWITFNASAIQSDLTGSTIKKTEVYLNNNHTWYNSGMTAAIGWDSKSSFGSTAADPAGSGIDLSDIHFNEGQAKWVTVDNAIASNFRSGAANCLVLWRNSNSLTYYGYFAGSGSPQLRITYSK